MGFLNIGYPWVWQLYLSRDMSCQFRRHNQLLWKCKSALLRTFGVTGGQIFWFQSLLSASIVSLQSLPTKHHNSEVTVIIQHNNCNNWPNLLLWYPFKKTRNLPACHSILLALRISTYWSFSSTSALASRLFLID